MKLVAGHPLALGIQRRIRRGDGVAIAQGESRSEGRRTGQHCTHRVPVKIGHQIGKPAAFGVYRAADGEFADLAAQCDVAGKLFGVLLGESARQHQRRGALRKRLGDRIERHHLRAGRSQEFVVLGVAESESLTGRDRHHWTAHHRHPRRILR